MDLKELDYLVCRLLLEKSKENTFIKIKVSYFHLFTPYFYRRLFLTPLMLN